MFFWSNQNYRRENCLETYFFPPPFSFVFIYLHIYLFIYFCFPFVSVLSFISAIFRVMPELTRRAFNYISQTRSSVFHFLLEVFPAIILATWPHTQSFPLCSTCIKQQILWMLACKHVQMQIIENHMLICHTVWPVTTECGATTEIPVNFH
jgi:hypothetical protein